MRIALCISGQPRMLSANIPILLNGLVNPSNITDIFIHTWYDPSLVGKEFESAQPGQSNKLGIWAQDTIPLLESLRPKKLMIEKPKSFEEFNHLENLPSAIQTHLASNVYSVYKANILKSEYECSNGFKYDIVIKTRIDCVYHRAYNILEYLDQDWEKVIHVPYMHQHMRVEDEYPISKGGVYSSLSDTFAYGTSDNIDKFCSIYPNFEEIYKAIVPYQYGECYFGYQVRHNYNIGISMQPIEYHLNRG